MASSFAEITACRTFGDWELTWVKTAVACDSTRDGDLLRHACKLGRERIVSKRKDSFRPSNSSPRTGIGVSYQEHLISARVCWSPANYAYVGAHKGTDIRAIEK